MKKVSLVTLAIAGLASAAPLVIPPDQPVCRLYSIIQILGTVGGVLLAAYAGLQLSTSQDMAQRSTAKLYISGVVVGLIIIWLAPLLVKNLVGAADICGW